MLCTLLQAMRTTLLFVLQYCLKLGT
ncbi:MAG: hypothetical protein JWM35_2432, partial [Verrucomicrobia bacterium]|nr:hypothetical protein [Verrucomicrobiota bacterium]